MDVAADTPILHRQHNNEFVGTVRTALGWWVDIHHPPPNIPIAFRCNISGGGTASPVLGSSGYGRVYAAPDQPATSGEASVVLEG